MKEKLINFLRWTERFTETDMLYIFRAGFWVVFGKMGMALVSFSKMIVFGRLVDPSLYGNYSFLISTAALLAIFSLPGIETSLIKAIANKKEGTVNSAAKERLKFSLIGSALSILIALYYFYLKNHELGISFLIIALFLPFKESFNLFSPFWIGKKDFKRHSLYTLAAAVLTTLIMIPLISFTHNLILIILAFMAGFALFNGIFFKIAQKSKINDDNYSQAIRFGKDLTIMGAIEYLGNNLDKVIIFALLGPIELAIYSFAQTPIAQIQEIIPIKQLALPKIGEKSLFDIKKGLIKKFKKLFLVSIPTAAVAIIVAPTFYKIVLPQYVDSIPLFQLLSLTIIFVPFILLESALIAEMRRKEVYTIQVTVPIIKIVLLLFLIPFWGLWGVVASILISQIVLSILTLRLFINSSD